MKLLVSIRLGVALVAIALINVPASAQNTSPATAPADAPTAAAPAATPPATPAAAPAPTALDAMSWLQGCWAGKVNRREFRELWLSPAGGMMIGLGQTVMGNRTTDFEYMRLELQTDGSVNYVTAPNKQAEVAFKLTDAGPEDFVFTSAALEFPQRIVYHRGSEGWLYARTEGKIRGVDKQVTYPMRHVDCMSGELVTK